MTGLRSILGLVFLMTTALVFGEIDSPSPALARAADLPVPCNLVSWPSDIQNRLNGEFGSWKVQEPENLSEYTRKTWAGKKLPGWSRRASSREWRGRRIKSAVSQM